MRIYCIPGQGVNHKLFSRIILPGYELIPLKWISPEKNETMRSYAEKLSSKINSSRPFCLLGVSLGGMLCVEMSDFLKPEKTIIISSAKCRYELPFKIRCMKRFPVYKLFGNKSMSWLANHNRWLFGVKEGDAQLFIEMLKNPPGIFLNGPLT